MGDFYGAGAEEVSKKRGLEKRIPDFARIVCAVSLRSCVTVFQFTRLNSGL
jgi:hypothetical protein